MPLPDFDDPDLPLQVLFVQWPAMMTYFLSRGMLCFGCPVAPFHTLADACLIYRLDEVQFRGELRAALLRET